METKTDKIIFSFLMASAIATTIYVAFVAFEESQIVTCDYFPNELDYEYLELGYKLDTLDV